jgi:hypothetical protein
MIPVFFLLAFNGLRSLSVADLRGWCSMEMETQCFAPPVVAGRLEKRSAMRCGAKAGGLLLFLQGRWRGVPENALT